MKSLLMRAVWTFGGIHEMQNRFDSTIRILAAREWRVNAHVVTLCDNL